MALSDRVITIDNASGTPTDYSALVVGGAGDFGGIDFASQDLTGPSATRPRKSLTGFVTNKTFTLTFEFTAAIKTAFYDGAATSQPRTCLLTWAASDSWSGEANIIGVKVNTEPGENGITTVDVTFEPTGTETIA